MSWAKHKCVSRLVAAGTRVTRQVVWLVIQEGDLDPAKVMGAKVMDCAHHLCG
jgi:hypothetical protein